MRRRQVMRPIVISIVIVTLLAATTAMAGPSIAGSMQGWDPADPDYDLTLQYWGVYELFKNLPQGIYEYKAIDGDAWGLDFPGLNQSFETIGPVTSVWWYVNLGANPGVREGDEYVMHSLNFPIVAGDMQSELGGVDWDPTDTVNTVMSQDYTMLFKFEAIIEPAGEYQCKIVLNNNWDQDTGPNISFYSDGINKTVFTYDMATNTTTVSTQVVTQQDVTVTFAVCLPEGVETSGDVCVTGGPAQLGYWNSGVTMTQACPDVSPGLYTVDVLFPAGTEPYFEYKYKKDGCATWESSGNHSATIDDSATIQVLPVDGWEYATPDCPDCTTPVENSTWGMIKALYK
jgi:hypothetical protein